MTFEILLIGGIVVLIFLYLRNFKKNDSSEYLNLTQRIDNLSGSFNQALRETIQSFSGELRKQSESVERSSLRVDQRVQDFTKGITSLGENLKQVHESVKTVSSFQKLFQSPKLRGQWGESSLSGMLSQFYPKELYQLQYGFSNGEVVDAVLKLPNKRLLPIDAKFPLENFEKMTQAEDDTLREQHKKLFISDIKREIDSISVKYIIPAEGTVNSALLYIPAEAIYYEIVNNMKDDDISSYAWSKRIILTSPNTFYLTLSTIQHWFRDIQITEKTKYVIKKLERVARDGTKLGDDFRKLGKHLSDARGSYDESEKRLGLMLNRVENVMEVSNEEEKEEKKEEKQEEKVMN